MGQIEIRQAGAGTPAATGDFFICDMPWASPKDDMASMEHPLFTLATRPDRRILRYEHGEASIEVTPSVKGLATIHDKDVLIYCVSQLMAALNEGRPTSPVLQLTAHDLLLATNRETSRRRLPAAARGAGAAVGDADRHQHRHRRGREHARLRADRRLGDPAQDQGRADDPRHGDALGLDVPLGGVEVGADAAPGLFPACASRWSGGSTRSRASIAAGRRSGGSGSRRC